MTSNRFVWRNCNSKKVLNVCGQQERPLLNMRCADVTQCYPTTLMSHQFRHNAVKYKISHYCTNGFEFVEFNGYVSDQIMFEMVQHYIHEVVDQDHVVLVL